MMMKIFIILFTFIGHCFGCEFSDITGKESFNVRENLMIGDDMQDNPGVRLAWKEMKEMNKIFKIGTVDEVVKNYEKNLCNGLDTDEFKKNNPGAKIKIQKTDFKGYYITCTPKEACKGVDLEKPFREGKIKNPKFPATDDIPEPTEFKLSTAPGKNYRHGSVNDRVADSFADYDPRGNQDVGDFLDKKMREGIAEATGVSDLVKADDILKSVEFQNELQEHINKFRTGQADKIPEKYKKIIQTLDAMEIPFEASDNFDEALNAALKTDSDGISNTDFKNAKGPFEIARAQGGDDMTLVIKDRNGQIVKIVGADARGLGLMNMTTRLEAFVGSSLLNQSTNTFEDILRISGDAIGVADKNMFGSMDTYVDILEYNLNNSGLTDMDQIVRRAHDDYMLLATGSEEEIKNNKTLRELQRKLGAEKFNHLKDHLMHMRAGAMNDCGASTKTVKDRITTIHNTIKAMEKAGIDGYFGESCIGAEYWARKLGAKGLREIGD